MFGNFGRKYFLGYRLNERKISILLFNYHFCIWCYDTISGKVQTYKPNFQFTLYPTLGFALSTCLAKEKYMHNYMKYGFQIFIWYNNVQLKSIKNMKLIIESFLHLSLNSSSNIFFSLFFLHLLSQTFMCLPWKPKLQEIDNPTRKVSYDFVETCVFGKQLLELSHCNPQLSSSMLAFLVLLWWWFWNWLH